MIAMWHCSVKSSSRPIRDGSRIYPQMPANRERIAFREGARGIQTLYMTGQNANEQKNTRDGKPARRLLQALIDGSY
jgi:hypothetical protein